MNRIINILLIAGIIIFGILLLGQFPFRFDMTETKEYTLSNATTDILENLEEPVTIKAYFTEGLDPNFKRGRKAFQDKLLEYAAASNGNVVYEFINPNESTEREQEAAQAGIRPLQIQSRDRSDFKVQRAYMGALLEMGDRKEVIPFVQPGAAMEHSLSTNIKKLSVINKPAIGLVQGHGEPGLGELMQVYQELSVLYNVENVTLDQPIDSKYKTIAIVAPKDSFPPQHFVHLAQFLQGGGRMFIAINRVTGNLQELQGIPINTGLETWLANKGMIVEGNFVVDAKCGSISVRQQQGIFQFNTPVQFPYLPILNEFSDIPIAKGLEGIALQFASSLKSADLPGMTFTPFAFTSNQSGVQPLPVTFDIQKNWGPADFNRSKIPVAAILEGKFGGDMASKMVVVGDGDFPISGPQGQQRQISENNVALMVNSIDWLSDDTGLIELRTRTVNYRPIKELEEGTKNLYRYANFLIPILLLVLYAFIRFTRNRNKRMSRMQEDYS